MVASLPGAGTCKKVTRVHKGQLSPAGNRTISAKAKAGLTARLTSRGSAILLSFPTQVGNRVERRF